MTQTELARELKLERASIGQTIDRLEELEPVSYTHLTLPTMRTV